MKFRLLTSDDINAHKDALKKLLCICMECEIISSAFEKIVNIKIENMYTYVNDGTATVIGAFENQLLIGFIWAYPVEVMEKMVFHIAYLSVIPQYRNKGIGRIFITMIEKIAKEKGYNRLELNVSAINVNAIRFYETNEFETSRITMGKQLCTKE